jgi:CheY-like chemotaxis protein
LAESFQPKIVFLGLAVPNMSGYEVAFALNHLPCLATVYIAALTGWNDLKTREQVPLLVSTNLTMPAKVEMVSDLVEHAIA